MLDLKISRQAKAAIVDATAALSMETEIGRERHQLLMLCGDRTSEQSARLAEIEALLLSIPRVTERLEDREAMELIRRAAKELPAGGTFGALVE